MATSLKLVGPDGAAFNYAPACETLTPPQRGRFETRVAFAAAHVVADPIRTADPLTRPIVDWDSTIAYREYLWSLGFGVAEAMDTAERGMGLDWPLALELIKRSTSAANACGGLVASGAGTDHLSASHSITLQDVTHAYLEQCEAIEAVGGRIILMASRALAAVAVTPKTTHRSMRRCCLRFTIQSSFIGWARCLIRRLMATGVQPRSPRPLRIA